MRKARLIAARSAAMRFEKQNRCSISLALALFIPSLSIFWAPRECPVKVNRSPVRDCISTAQ